MNYLAHAFLSYNIIPIQVGNLFGDFVKGKQIETLPQEIQAGIQLHRKIDLFTDAHPLIIEAVSLFKPHFRLSGGIFVDILFDHFLANDEHHFTKQTLKEFTTSVYKNLFDHKMYMNYKMHNYFTHMEKYDWLYHYRFEKGLRQSIEGLCQRYPKLGHGASVIKHVELHKESFANLYLHFFPDLLNFVEDSKTQFNIIN